MAQMVKNLPAMQETQVQSLDEGKATHSSIIAWRIPLTEEPGGQQSMGVTKSWDTTEWLNSNLSGFKWEGIDGMLSAGYPSLQGGYPSAPKCMLNSHAILHKSQFFCDHFRFLRNFILSNCPYTE